MLTLDFSVFQSYLCAINKNTDKVTSRELTRLASVGILGKEREPRVGKLGWYGNFDTGFERTNVISFKIPCAGFLNFFEIMTVY